jgi:hypothetical protein
MRLEPFAEADFDRLIAWSPTPDFLLQYVFLLSRSYSAEEVPGCYSPRSARVIVMTIRFATVADAPLIAQVHMASWKEAYRGQLPSDGLDKLDVYDCTLRWQQVLPWMGLLRRKPCWARR